MKATHLSGVLIVFLCFQCTIIHAQVPITNNKKPTFGLETTYEVDKYSHGYLYAPNVTLWGRLNAKLSLGRRHFNYTATSSSILRADLQYAIIKPNPNRKFGLNADFQLQRDKISYPEFSRFRNKHYAAQIGLTAYKTYDLGGGWTITPSASVHLRQDGLFQPKHFKYDYEPRLVPTVGMTLGYKNYYLRSNAKLQNGRLGLGFTFGMRF